MRKKENVKKSGKEAGSMQNSPSIEDQIDEYIEYKRGLYKKSSSLPQQEEKEIDPDLFSIL